MPQYMLAVHVPRTASPDPSQEATDPTSMMERIGALEERMRDSRALVSSVRLADASKSVVVDASGDAASQPLVTDGPYLEAKELIGGFYVVEADSRDVAIGWAVQTSEAIGMPIEVRPFLDHRDE